MAQKLCPSCETSKPEDDFAKNSTKKDGRAVLCKLCMKAYCAQHYKANKQIYKDRAKARKNVTKQNNFPKLIEYLERHPCVDCGEADLAVLEFDHITGTKYANISRMVVYNSWEMILKEIEKCVVRCANCHRKKTAREFGWIRARFLSTMGV